MGKEKGIITNTVGEKIGYNIGVYYIYLHHIRNAVLIVELKVFTVPPCGEYF